MNPTPATPATPATAAGRSAGWDQLKAWTTLLVVLHHTAITYGAIGGWFYKEVAPDMAGPGLLLVVFCTVNQAWFMGLFFLLAGRFTPPSIQRKGRWHFMRDRLLRLGVPWLVFGFFLGPATIALARTADGNTFTSTLLALWRHGSFEPGPMWFAQALLIFSAAAAVWPWPTAERAAAGRAAAPPPPHAFPSHGTLVLAAVGCAVAAFALRLVWPVGAEVWHMQLGYFASYVLLFAAGCMAAQRGWLDNLPPPLVRRWRRVAWWVLPTLLPLALLPQHMPVFAGNPNGGWTLPAAMYALWEPFVAWGVLLGLLARLGRHGTALPHWRQALARRAYAIFVIHPPVVVGVCLAWRGVAAPALLKCVVSGALACVACYVVAGLLLRVPGLRRVL